MYNILVVKMQIVGQLSIVLIVLANLDLKEIQMITVEKLRVIWCSVWWTLSVANLKYVKTKTA